MNIKIKSLQLLNFKGCKDLSLNFGSQTDISGANATGKTRIFDAFTWLFFGKDSDDRKDFNIKCLDQDGEPLHRAETFVTGVLEVDGMTKTFQRGYKENWQKKKGEEHETFTGHETLYYIDGVPMLQKEYVAAVGSIISEELFKLLTNPFCFSGMKWDSRRDILFRMAQIGSDEQIASLKPEFNRLLDAMAGKPLELFLRQLSESKKKLKYELSQIPPRIDELIRSILLNLNFALISKNIKEKETELDDIQKQISSKRSRAEAKNKEVMGITQKIHDLRMKVQTMQNSQQGQRQRTLQDLDQKIEAINLILRNQKNIIDSNMEGIAHKKQQVKNYTEEIDKLRAQWTETDEAVLTFDDNYNCCPTCHQVLPEDQLEDKRSKMQKFFNEETASKLKRIEEDGVRLKRVIEQREAEIKDMEAQITEAKAVISKNTELKDQLSSDKELANLPAQAPDTSAIEAEIKELEASVGSIAGPDTKELEEKAAVIKTELDALKAELAQKETIDRAQKRIEELKKEEESYAQQLADLEKLEFMAESFDKYKVTLVEQEINSHFKIVRFKMFNKLINGGTEPSCDILINGVPFPDANNASKINAGVDIINALSSFYGITAPVFIDNAEAVNEILPTPSQLIRLVVTTDPQIKINTILS